MDAMVKVIFRYFLGGMCVTFGNGFLAIVLGSMGTSNTYIYGTLFFQACLCGLILFSLKGVK